MITERNKRFLSRYGSDETISVHYDKFSNPEKGTMAAHNQFIGNQTINKLISDPNDSVRITTSKRKDLSSEHLDKLTNDSNDTVRFSTAYNPKLETHHIDKLISDPDEYIVGKVASHADLSDKNIETLMKHSSEQVRYQLTFNNNLKKHHYHKLSSDIEPSVRQRAHEELTNWDYNGR